MLERLHLNPIEFLVRDLICITPPYYALYDLALLQNGILEGICFIENNETDEATIISSSEAGRHLAILGSGLLALENEDKSKHYYLVTHATTVYRHKDLTGIQFNQNKAKSKLIGQAKLISLDLKGKTGKVETKLFTEFGRQVFTMEITYQIIKEDIFSRLFQSNYVFAKPSQINNPYTRQIEIDNLRSRKNNLKGDIGVVQPEQCLGHFENFPALPIAILSSAMINLAGKHLKRILKRQNIRYALSKADLAAFRLAFAGERILLNSNYIDTSEFGIQFVVEATNENGVAIGEIGLFFDHVTN